MERKHSALFAELLQRDSLKYRHLKHGEALYFGGTFQALRKIMISI